MVSAIIVDSPCVFMNAGAQADLHADTTMSASVDVLQRLSSHLF